MAWGARNMKTSKHALIGAILAAASLLSAPVAAKPAQTAPAPVLPPANASLQVKFDAASDAAAAGDCGTALTIFAGLASDPHIRPGSIPAAALAVRRGRCLILTGAYADGEAMIALGLPALRKAGDSFRIDIANAEQALGDAAVARWDHSAALAHYGAALGLLTGDDRLSPLMRLAQVTAFDGGGASLGYVDQAIAQIDSVAKPDKHLLAGFDTVRGRTLLNQGSVKAGYAELKKALALRGGLSSRVSLEDASMRYDLAEAALLSGDPDQARMYLAYTGAGRIQQSPFANAAYMEAPPCGPETGLKPADMAVVEFSINDSGRVVGTQTIYARGGADQAAAFARSVSGWRWDPAKLAAIPAFYRLLSRVELRCSNALGVAPDVLTPLRNRFLSWASEPLASSDVHDLNVATGFERLHAIAAEKGAAGQVPAQVAALTAAALYDPIAGDAVLADLDKALALARQARLPGAVTNLITVYRAEVARRNAENTETPRAHVSVGLKALAQDPAIAADPLAQDTAILLAVPPRPNAAERAETTAAFAQVASDERLGKNHPLRQLALLRLANLAAGENDAQKAQAYFARTGLSEQQCALIGAVPAMRSSGASSADYPREALMMGFEGWVQVETDIDANGSTRNQRPLIAYPPFVFVDAATGMARDFRYQASYRPGGGAACSAKSEVIRFVIPR